MESKKSIKAGIGYRLYKHYVRFMQNCLLYRHVHYLNTERIPAQGVPCIIVSNHQNCANDPLGILIGLENETRPYVIARGDAFDLHPLIAKFFYWIGMLPAFRLAFDGEESLKKNEAVFRISGGKLLEGNRLIMFPEAGHQNKRWLGEFKFGYTRLAFQTAEMGNFETDVVIMPCAHHYESYTGLQHDFMVTYGEPISLKPYYKLYKTKPRTAQREVNKLVRAQIESLMLNVRDLDNYDAIDFLRQTYGRKLAEAKHLNPKYLPDMLASNREFVAAMADYQQTNPDEVKAIYDDARTLKAGIERLNIADSQFDKQPKWWQLALSIVAQILLLPLWLVSLFPGGITYNLPKLLLRTDVMFTNTLIFILNVVVLLPLMALITLLVMGCAWGWWWQACVWILLWPALQLFAWYNYKWMQRTCQGCRFVSHRNAKTIGSLRNLRNQLYDKLNKIFNI